MIKISTRHRSQEPTTPPAAATRSLVMVPAAVHGLLERQTAGDAATTAAVASRSDTAFPRSTVARPTVR